jgi:hypothetical protein
MSSSSVTHIVVETASYLAIGGSISLVSWWFLKRFAERLMVRHTAMRYVAKTREGRPLLYDDLKRIYEGETDGILTEAEAHQVMKAAKAIMVSELRMDTAEVDDLIAVTESSIPGKRFADSDLGCASGLAMWHVIGMIVLVVLLPASRPGVAWTVLSAIAVTVTTVCSVILGWGAGKYAVKFSRMVADAKRALR